MGSLDSLAMDYNELPYQKIVFVCCNQRAAGERVCCAAGRGQEIRDALKRLVKERGLKSRIRVSQSGCMDRCEDGPNVMIFPDNRWISHVTPDDVPAILDMLTEDLHAGS